MTDRTAIVHARVSTAEQAASGPGIAAQAERCRGYADSRGVAAENGVSGTLAHEDRPVLGPVLAELAGDGGPDMLTVAKLDRLGRDVRDVLALAERADREDWGLVVLDLESGPEPASITHTHDPIHDPIHGKSQGDER